MRLLPVAITLSLPLAAQEPLTDAAALVPDWRIPIHSGPDDAFGQPYGLWASGTDYKASFHDGFSFYPFLGPDYPENLPLRWRTVAVTAGGEVLADGAAAPERHWTDWRFEYRYGRVTEAYDLLPEGVEQTFVVHSRPAAGDLTVTGRIVTPLRAAAQDAAHLALEFRDAEGDPIVRYGEATAVDAAGRRMRMTTAFDGTQVRLKLDGDWLREAAFPVVVDPLTSAVVLHSGAAGSPGSVMDTDVVRQSHSSNPLFLMVHSRRFSGGDRDAYGHVFHDDLRNATPIWVDMHATWSAVRPRCAFSFALSQPRWLIVVQRTLGTTSRVRVYMHAPTSLTLNTGVTRDVAPPPGREHLRPDVGGGSRPEGLVVMEEQPTGSNRSDVRGVLVDTVAASLGPQIALASHLSAFEDRKQPSVTTSTRFSSWVVAWVEKSTLSASDDWDLVVNRIHSTGSRGLDTELGPAGSNDVDVSNPVVDGDSGEFLVAWEFANAAMLSRGTGRQRFDWHLGSQPVPGTRRTRTASALAPRSLQGVAFDPTTTSHWCLVYTRGNAMEVMRVGWTGGMVEAATLPASGLGLVAGGVGYGGGGSGFLVTSGVNGLFNPIQGQFLEYDPGAGVQYYGSACSPLSPRIASHSPYAGHGRFSLFLLSPSSVHRGLFLLAAPFPGNRTLPRGGCTLLLDPGSVVIAGVEFQPSLFSRNFTVPLPDDPVFIGDFYFQFAWFTNSHQIRTSQGAHVMVR